MGNQTSLILTCQKKCTKIASMWANHDQPQSWIGVSICSFCTFGFLSRCVSVRKVKGNHWTTCVWSLSGPLVSVRSCHVGNARRTPSAHGVWVSACRNCSSSLGMRIKFWARGCLSKALFAWPTASFIAWNPIFLVIHRTSVAFVCFQKLKAYCPLQVLCHSPRFSQASKDQSRW